MSLVAGAYAGLAAGGVMVFLSHVAPRLGAGNYIREVFEPVVLGRILSRREAQLVGVLFHLLLSLLFGIGFAFFVGQHWLSGFFVHSLFAWSVVMTLVIGLIIMPLEGHGWFGLKHDAWFMIDAFLTNLIWGFLFLGFVRLWTVV